MFIKKNAGTARRGKVFFYARWVLELKTFFSTETQPGAMTSSSSSSRKFAFLTHSYQYFLNERNEKLTNRRPKNLFFGLCAKDNNKFRYLFVKLLFRKIIYLLTKKFLWYTFFLKKTVCWSNYFKSGWHFYSYHFILFIWWLIYYKLFLWLTNEVDSTYRNGMQLLLLRVSNNRLA